MRHLPPPPAHVEPYVRVLGVETTVEVFLHFGGSELYLASNPKGGSELAQKIGRDKAAALAQSVGHLKVRVPTAKPWLARCLYARGLPKAQIARKLHTTDVTVRKWLDGETGGRFDDPRQLGLFS